MIPIIDLDQFARNYDALIAEIREIYARKAKEEPEKVPYLNARSLMLDADRASALALIQIMQSETSARVLTTVVAEHVSSLLKTLLFSMPEAARSAAMREFYGIIELHWAAEQWRFVDVPSVMGGRA